MLAQEIVDCVLQRHGVCEASLKANCGNRPECENLSRARVKQEKSKLVEVTSFENGVSDVEGSCDTDACVLLLKMLFLIGEYKISDTSL